MKKIIGGLLVICLVFSHSPVSKADTPQEFYDTAKSIVELADSVYSLYVEEDGTAIVGTVQHAIEVGVNTVKLTVALYKGMDSAMADWLNAHLAAYNTSLATYFLDYQIVYKYAAADLANRIDPTTRKKILTTLTDNLIEAFNHNIDCVDTMLSEHSVWYALHNSQKVLIKETKEYSQALKENTPNFYSLYCELRLTDEFAQKPSAPTGLKAVKATSTTAVVSWNPVSGATSYQVQYWRQGMADFKDDSDYKTASATSFTSKGLGNYDTFKYRVRAKNSAGASAWSSEYTYNKNSVPITGISLNSTSVDLKVGDPYQLTATISPSNTTDSKTLTWSSANTGVVTVSSGGLVTAKGMGTAAVTAKTSNGKTASCSFTVTALATYGNITLPSVYYQQEDNAGCYIAAVAMIVANYDVLCGQTPNTYATVKKANGNSTYMSWSTPEKLGLSDKDIFVSSSSGISSDAKLSKIVAGLQDSPYGLFASFRDSASTSNFDYSHAVVIVGYRDGNIIINDPARGSGGEGIKLTDSKYLTEKYKSTEGVSTLSQAQLLNHLRVLTKFVPTSAVYDIRFDANGGKGAPARIQKRAGTDRVLSGGVPTRSGYTFSGWGLTANATSAAYQPGDRYTKDASVTLYAVWSAIPTPSTPTPVTTPSPLPGYTVKPSITPAPTPTPKPVKPTSVQLGQTGTVKLNLGDTLTLTPVLSPSNAATTYTWKSSSSKIAKVSKKGVVTPVKEGTVTITVTTKNGKKASVKVKVVDPYKPTSVKLDQTGTVKLKLGETLQLTPALSPSTAETTYTWKSSSSKIAKVSKKGVVTPVKEGKVTITVTTKNGKKATVKVKVVDPYKPTSVKLDQTGTVKLKLGETLQLTPALSPSTAETTYTWKSSSSKIAKVSKKGVVTPVKEGTVTITVTTKNGKKATVKIKVIK